MKTVGFIGLGNVGSKLVGSLLRNNCKVFVQDLHKAAAQPLLKNGASWCSSPKKMAELSDILITCLPSPEVSASVMESDDGILRGLSSNKIWAEMSTTDVNEVTRLGALVSEKGAYSIDCPVSGGCHRAATGNISIFAGCERHVFQKMLPILKMMGQKILHTGELGTASVLKVITNYLATANLVTLCEALVTSKKAKMDMNIVYEAIRISSGNSFVHETESQVILNGSRDINFTMGLVLKDLNLFQELASLHNVPLEISPLLINIFTEGQKKFGSKAWSPRIIERLEEVCNVDVLAPGFPAEIVDKEPEKTGYEVIVQP